MYNVKNLDNDLKECLEILSKRYPFIVGEEGREIVATKIEEEILEIKATKEKIFIKYKDKPSFFRAIMLVDLKEKENIFEFETKNNIYFSFNGLMIDCSRNGVLNIKYAKEMIEQLALIGQNVFMLYMEDTYKLESEPYFGYLRGAYSKEELKELDDYAYKFGIELIPCIQTLAHLDQFFMWEEIATKYADIDNILNVSREEVKKFLDNMIKYLSSTLRTNKIHIGMDEAYNLGRGSYADDNGLKHKTQIMREHLENMLSICKKYNVEPIIWDDMFFSNYSRTDKSDYKIPDGISLMYWDYYNNTVEHYEENFEIRGKITNKPIMFAGGSWRWIGYASHHGKTLASTNASLTACKNKGIREVMTTAWADDGCESPSMTAMFGSVLFGEHSYNKDIDLEEFKKHLLYITKMDYENFMKIQEYDIFKSINIETATVTPSKYTLYEDPLCSKFILHTKDVVDDLTTDYKNLAIYFEEKVKSSDDEIVKSTNEFYASFGKVLSLKWNLGLNIYNAYKNKDKKRLEEIIKTQIEPLIPLVEELKEARMKEWYLTNKSYGFEVLDLRFGGIVSRLKSSKVILEAFIQDKISKIEELEEGRLPATHYREEKMGDILHYNRAQRCMTASKMIW